MGKTFSSLLFIMMIIHGGLEFGFIDFTITVCVDIIKMLVNHVVGFFSMFLWDVLVDASVDLGLGEGSRFIDVAVIDDLGGGWFFISLEGLSKSLSWLFSLLSLLWSGIHGGLEFALIDFTITVCVDIIKMLVNHVVGFLSMFLWDVLVDASVNLGLGEGSRFIDVAVCDDVGGGWWAFWLISFH